MKSSFGAAAERSIFATVIVIFPVAASWATAVISRSSLIAAQPARVPVMVQILPTVKGHRFLTASLVSPQP